MLIVGAFMLANPPVLTDGSDGNLGKEKASYTSSTAGINSILLQARLSIPDRATANLKHGDSLRHEKGE